MVATSKPFVDRRKACAACATVLLLGLDGIRSTADEVTWVDRSGRQTVGSGTVLQDNLDELRMELPSGVVRRIAGSRVVAVSTEFLKPHREARQLEQERSYEAALAAYGQAYRQENRDWVKQQLLARIIVCRAALGDTQTAASGFLALLKHDPATRYRAVIPIPWQPREANRQFASQAKTWIRDPRQPAAAKLIAASWLLSGSERGEAEDALRKLGTSDSNWIAKLAFTQLWRLRAVTVEADEVKRWQGLFDQLPADLTAGPAFVLAQALARHRQMDAAVLMYLQVAWRDPSRPDIAPEALWSAAQLLQETGRNNEALQLLRELVSAFPDSPFAIPSVDQIGQLQSR